MSKEHKDGCAANNIPKYRGHCDCGLVTAKNSCRLGCPGHESDLYRCLTWQEHSDDEDEWDRNYGAMGMLNRTSTPPKEKLKESS